MLNGRQLTALTHHTPYSDCSHIQELHDTDKGAKMELLQSACVISWSRCTVLKEIILPRFKIKSFLCVHLALIHTVCKELLYIHMDIKI